MSFRDFSFPAVIEQLGLSIDEADFTSHIQPVTVRRDFAETINRGVELSVGINSEKARSEFVVAPLLLETRELTEGGFGLLSGLEFNVDASKGLNGVTDFLLTRPPRLLMITAPVVVVVEVKNDTIRDAYAQCVAEMRASQIFNQRKGMNWPLHGVVTTGSDWRFLRLQGDTVTFDLPTYFITDPGKIIAVIKHMVESVALAPAAA